MAEDVSHQDTLGPVDDMDDWSGSGSDQDAMVDDFAEGMEEIVVDGNGKPMSTDANPQEGIEENDTNATQTTDEGGQEEGQTEADPLVSDFFKDGNFDADSAIDFLGIGKEQQAQAQNPVAQPQQQVQNDQAQAQQSQQPQVDEFEQIKKDRLGWIEAINQRIMQDQAAGRQTDLFKALNDLAMQQQAEVAELIQQKRLDRIEESRKADQKSFEERMAAKELEPKAESNLQALANELKLTSADKARTFLFDDKYGGSLLRTVYDFVAQFKPEWSNAKGQAAEEAYKQFLVSFTSDRNRVRSLGDFALARLQKQIMPKLIQQARGAGRVQEQASRKASNKGSPIRTRGQQRPDQSKGGDPIQSWLNDDSRIASL